MYYSFALAGHRGTCLRPLHIFALLCFALNFHSRERKFPWTFIPGSECSQWEFAPRSENTGERKIPEPCILHVRDFPHSAIRILPVLIQ